MKLATTICGVATFGLTTAVLAVNNSPVPGYGAVELTWDVETTPGGPTVQLSGTVQQVHEQVLKINPHYEQEFNITYECPSELAAASNLASRSMSPQGNPLGKRGGHTECNNYGDADYLAILDGIQYLRYVPGTPANGPGPNNCGRMSCSFHSAIWWCNDNPFTKTLTWKSISDSAQYTLNVCPIRTRVVSGRNFNDGNWNTIIDWENC